MNLKTLYNKIADICNDADPNMGSIFYGDVYLLNHIQTVEYPAVVVTSGQHRGKVHDGFFMFRLNIFYVERLLDDDQCNSHA